MRFILGGGPIWKGGTDMLGRGGPPEHVLPSDWYFGEPYDQGSVNIVHMTPTELEFNGITGGRRYLAFVATFQPGTRIRFSLTTTGTTYSGLDDEPEFQTPRIAISPGNGWQAGTHQIDFVCPENSDDMTYFCFLVPSNHHVEINGLTVNYPE